MKQVMCADNEVSASFVSPGREKKLLKRSPLAAPAVALACGIWAARITGLGFTFWVLGGLVSLFVVMGVCVSRLKGNASLLLSLGTVFIIGGCLYNVANLRMEGTLGRFSGERVVIRGSVVSPPLSINSRYPSSSSRASVVLVEPVSVIVLSPDAISQLVPDKGRRNGGEKIQVRILAKPGMRLPTYGDTALFTGTLERPEGPRNPGEYDRRVRLWMQGVAYTLDAGRNWVITGGGRGNPLARFVFGLRSKANRVVEETLPEPEASTVQALALGDRSSLDKELGNEYRVTGLAHILSVSGMHVGFIAAGLNLLLKRFPISPFSRAASLVGVLTVYSAVTGMQAPVVRAAIMAGAAALGTALGRPVSSLNTLALASIFILAIWPYSLFDAGFQLSFLATLGIILLYKRMFNVFNSLFIWSHIPWTRVRHVLAQGLAVTTAAQVATIPPILTYFGSLSLMSPLANILAAPLAGAAVWLGFLGVAAGLCSHLAAYFLNSATGATVFLLNAVVERVADFPGLLTLSRPHPIGVFTYYAALLAFCRLWPFHRFRPSAAFRFTLVVCLVLSIGIRLPPSGRGLMLVFLDVGQGDGMVVHLPGGKVMVVDGGPIDDRRALLSYLRYCGVRRVDYLVVTHGDADHIGGLLDVVKYMAVGEIWESGVAPESDLYGQLRALIRERVLPVRRPIRGEIYSVAPGVDVEVLNPPLPLNRGTPSDVNNNSLVLRLRHGNVRILLTADLEEEGEAMLMASGIDPVADILKVAHHGSVTSSSGVFLDRVRASLAVIQVGRRNRYGMPSPKVLARIRTRGMTIRRTDWEGAVTVRTDGRKVSVWSMRGRLMEWVQ